MSGQEKSVWFITGCSTGFGRELAKQLLENDYRVVVTARDVNKVQDLVEINSENALAIALDVTDEAQIKQAVEKADAGKAEKAGADNKADTTDTPAETSRPAADSKSPDSIKKAGSAEPSCPSPQ